MRARLVVSVSYQRVAQSKKTGLWASPCSFRCSSGIRRSGPTHRRKTARHPSSCIHPTTTTYLCVLQRGQGGRPSGKPRGCICFGTLRSADWRWWLPKLLCSAPLWNREVVLITFCTDTSPVFACRTLGRSYSKYLRSTYAAVSKSRCGTKTRVQSEERSSKKEGHRLYSVMPVSPTSGFRYERPSTYNITRLKLIKAR